MEQGDSRGAVAAVRALDRAGWCVGVGAPGAVGLAAASRGSRYRHHVPAAHRDLDGFIAAVVRADAAVGYDVVFGAGEAEVLALSSRRGAIAPAVPYAADDVVRHALDKVELEASAAAAGLRVPPVVALDDIQEAAMPYVVKARRHADPNRAGAPPRVDTNVVVGAEAVRRRVAQIQADGADVLIQEFLDGDLVAYAAVADRQSRVIADSMQVASRIWPPLAGASCRARTTPVDADLAAAAQRLFTALGWFGLAELQFVVPPGGAPHLIDFNGRFYGSMNLAVTAGANLPHTWACLATQRPVLQSQARPGVAYQWLEGDLRRALVERRGGVVRDVATTLATAAGARHSLLDGGDLAPALLRLRRVVSEAWPGSPSG